MGQASAPVTFPPKICILRNKCPLVLANMSWIFLLTVVESHDVLLMLHVK
jgi:hypothetical protein